MSDPQQIEKDLREYLEKEPNLSRQDRIVYLQTIFHKHLEINKLEHLITKQDLFLIFSEASTHYTKMKTPVFVSKKALDPHESVHMAIMESFLSYLGRTKLLRKLVKFDYRE
jgi:PhoPQ-activated pathogenicity-related protein